MKKLYILIALAVTLTTSAQAYTIGGAYAQLLSCDWGQQGYEYGNIGTYKANGKIYQIFFGSNYCQY